MLTLCMMLLLEEAANLGQKWTGGYDGLDTVPIDPIFGKFAFNPLIPNTQFIYILCILFIGFVIVRTIVYSPFGESLTGIRENSLRMHAVGAPVRKRLWRLSHPTNRSSTTPAKPCSRVSAWRATARMGKAASSGRR